MLNSNRPEQMTNDGGVADARPACVALVPVVPTIHWSHVPDQQMSRADFVTQLIATAEYAPQTRSLRRGTPGDAPGRQRGDPRPIRSPPSGPTSAMPTAPAYGPVKSSEPDITAVEARAPGAGRCPAAIPARRLSAGARPE